VLQRVTKEAIDVVFVGELQNYKGYPDVNYCG
jgi:hypothetical protein